MSDQSQTPQRHFLLQEGIDLLRAKKPEEAYDILAQYLRIHPKSGEGWFFLSYSVPEISKKIECLERVREINPENQNAIERLEQLQEMLPDPTTEPEPIERPKEFRWAVVAMGALVIIVVALLGIWGYGKLFRPSEPTAEALITWPATSTSTVQPSFQTSTATITPIISLTPSPVPYHTATDIPIDDTTQKEMDEIKEQVSSLRKLDATGPVDQHMIGKERVRSILEAIYLERNTPDMVTDQVRVLSALGLIEPTYDLYSKTLDQIGENIGGFYIPWTDNLYLIGSEFNGIERFVFSHEYAHALVDQHFSLDSLGVYPECLSDTDRCYAITALVEGDATLLMYQWLEQFGTEEDINEILAAQYAPLDYTISSTNLPPPFVVRELNFKYGDGYQFVDYLYKIGRWKMVDLAYSRLPDTTEQILHPAKFQTRETPIPLEIPDLHAVLGDEWRFLKSDSLGELGTEMVLGYSAHRLAQLNPVIAAEAAAGWGGDQYQVFYKSTTNRSILAANWVWDYQSDADEFWNAMWEHLDHRYRGDQLESTKGSCWQLLNDHFSCLFRSGNQTLWIQSPDMDTLGLIRKQYPNFN